MKIDLINERNSEITRIEKMVYNELGNRARQCSRAEIIRLICQHPARRFYITPDIARRKVSEILRTGASSATIETRRQMYHDIHDGVVALLRRHQRMTLSDAVCEVIEQQAPSLYITPRSMTVILSRIEKNASSRRHQGEVFQNNERQSARRDRADD